MFRRDIGIQWLLRYEKLVFFRDKYVMLFWYIINIMWFVVKYVYMSKNK